MPTPYTGVESNVTADRADVSGTIPVDGDPRNASSVNTPIQRLFDFMQRVRKKAGFLDLASTWTAAQTFNVDGAGWQALPLSTGWESPNPDAANTIQPAFRVDSFGRCWLRGEAIRVSGTSPLIGVLPSGARPPAIRGNAFVVFSNHASGQSQVRVAGVNATGLANPGDVRIEANDATQVDLSGIAFYVNGK